MSAPSIGPSPSSSTPLLHVPASPASSAPESTRLPASTCRLMPGVAVRVRPGRQGEGPLHRGDPSTRRRSSGLVVELEKDILVRRARAHQRQIDVDRPVAVGVEPEVFPVVHQAIAILVGAGGDVEADLHRIVFVVVRIDTVARRAGGRGVPGPEASVGEVHDEIEIVVVGLRRCVAEVVAAGAVVVPDLDRHRNHGRDGVIDGDRCRPAARLDLEPVIRLAVGLRLHPVDEDLGVEIRRRLPAASMPAASHSSFWVHSTLVIVTVTGTGVAMARPGTNTASTARHSPTRQRHQRPIGAEYARRHTHGDPR